MNKLLQQLQEGTYELYNMYFTEYLDWWLNQVKPLIKDSTYEGYYKNVKGKIKPYFDRYKFKLLDLRPMHFTEYGKTAVSDITRQMGHSSTAVTEKIYVHSDKRVKDDNVKIIQAVLNGAQCENKALSKIRCQETKKQPETQGFKPFQCGGEGASLSLSENRIIILSPVPIYQFSLNRRK